jgi:hypothetical protein
MRSTCLALAGDDSFGLEEEECPFATSRRGPETTGRKRFVA